MPGGMTDGSAWTDTIVEQDWEGLVAAAEKSLLQNDAKLRKMKSDELCKAIMLWCKESKQTIKFKIAGILNIFWFSSELNTTEMGGSLCTWFLPPGFGEV